MIDHPEADGAGTTVYGHVRPHVAVGERVEAGQSIAEIEPDRTRNGNVAPHLHLEWHRSVLSPPGPDRMDPVPQLDGAAYPPVQGDLLTAFGIDISNHQGEFDFARAAAEGMSFATHKICQSTWRDPLWPRAREQMGAHFEFWGGYIYCRLDTTPDAEADAALGYLGDTTIPIQIDYEDPNGTLTITDLLARVDALTVRGFTLLPIYLPRWHWRDHMGAPDLSGLPVPIWNSHYVTGVGTPAQLYPGDAHPGWEPMGGKDIAILQFSSTAAIGGQRIDVNAIRGGRDQLAHLFRQDPDMQLTDIIINKDGNPVTLADLLASIDMHASWAVDQLAGPDSRHQRGPGLDPTGWPQLDGKSVVDSVAAAHDKIDAVTTVLAQVQDKIQVILETLDSDPYVGRHRAQKPE
ncbi:GH25 family lysozyme M1 (1,4-beta-N-acetylmuramidase) [Nocardia tenerifensis]|uniref:GH25 family lysozyme M1 (1,4-beta-N-acetylmuramidase) n=1 Tax=Nocardia tenerifensis TaxID=228006 RepID=A0A318JZJ4_9NOCA|nr:GH25 family lysozyme M1 (1,4-beta-N-acetylmuramidase) [Nocardia tenerifensis]